MLGFFGKIMPQRVKTKMLVVLSILVTLIVVLPVVRIYISTIDTALNTTEQSLKESLLQVSKKIVSDRVDQLTLIGISVASMPSIQDNLQFQSRSDLLDTTAPLYKHLNKTIEIDSFHFHHPPALSFLRLHNPDKYGDDQSGIHQIVVQANGNKNQVAGLEAIDDKLTVKAVVPVLYLNRRHAGTLSLGSPINQKLLEEVKELSNNDIGLIVPTGSGFEYQAKTHTIQLTGEDSQELKSIMTGGDITVKRSTSGNSQYMTAYLPLRDFSNRPVGVLSIPKDISDILGKAQKNALNFVLVGVVFLVIILCFIYFLFTKLVDTPIQRITLLLEAASRGDVSQEVNTKDIKTINCSEIMACGKEDCSMYAKEGYCWEEAGSAAEDVQCPKILSGEYNSCRECKKVFKKVVRDEFSELDVFMHAFMERVRTLLQDVNGSSGELNKSALTLSSISQEIDGGSTESATRAESVAAAAEEMSANMNMVAAATEEAAANVNVMTGATEEISSTVGDIQHSTLKAKEITTSAVHEAQDISQKVDELGSAAQDIGKVTETITDISGQTNLLALNATIEAARAGEAGKGFAVVANEIKELARQTAEATGEIKERIDGIQSSTGETVDGMRKISSIITEIDDIVGSITAAVEEQGVTISELITNISEAGQGISEVTENVAQSSQVSQEIAIDIAQVNSSAEEISDGTGKVLQNAKELKALSEGLQNLIAKFTV